jgi:acyl transferase domain-containing protein
MAGYTTDRPNETSTFPTERQIAKPKARLFVWSAHEESALKRVAAAYSNYLLNVHSIMHQDASVDNLAYTLSERRSHLRSRSFVIASSIPDLQQTLKRGFLTVTRSARPPNLAFVFTGQGAQWNAMGRELLDYPVFRRSLEDADVFFQDLGCTWTLIGMLSLKFASSLTDSLKTNFYEKPRLRN